MYNTNKDPQTLARKANYFRGFRACLILIVAPILIVFVAFCHFIINNLA